MQPQRALIHGPQTQPPSQPLPTAINQLTRCACQQKQQRCYGGQRRSPPARPVGDPHASQAPVCLSVFAIQGAGKGATGQCSLPAQASTAGDQSAALDCRASLGSVPATALFPARMERGHLGVPPRCISPARSVFPIGVSAPRCPPCLPASPCFVRCAHHSTWRLSRLSRSWLPGRSKSCRPTQWRCQFWGRWRRCCSPSCCCTPVQEARRRRSGRARLWRAEFAAAHGESRQQQLQGGGISSAGARH